MGGGVRSVQILKGREQQVHSMPSLERANKAHDKPTVKLKALSYRLAVQAQMEQARVNGVRQNPNTLRLHSGYLQLAAQRFRNRNRQTSLSPNSAFDPACEWRAGRRRAGGALFLCGRPAR